MFAAVAWQTAVCRLFIQAWFPRLTARNSSGRMRRKRSGQEFSAVTLLHNKLVMTEESRVETRTRLLFSKDKGEQHLLIEEEVTFS
jgi:hypothetical protein